MFDEDRENGFYSEEESLYDEDEGQEELEQEKEAEPEPENTDWQNHNCEECVFFKFSHMQMESVCDVRWYKCINKYSKRYEYEVDEFHLPRRACKYFKEKKRRQEN